MAMLVQRKVLLILFFLGLGLTLLWSCTDKPLATIKLAGNTMGTTYHITVVDPAGQFDSLLLQSNIDARLKQINQQFSSYISDSELMRFNVSPVDEWVGISPELFHVLLQSLEISWLSGGAFDITTGPLVNLWGFGNAGHGNIVPSQADIDELLSAVGFQNIVLDIGDIKLMKKTALQLDLSAIAKGYAVDQLVSLLQAENAQHFMVEIGGEIRVQGKNPNRQAWRIAIEEPNNSFGVIHRTLSITDKAVATSGGYRNYFEKDGKRYSHTISPVTGYPIEHNLVSVTVLADQSAIADALATAINVMGAEAGLKLAEQQALAVYLLIKTERGFEAKYSDAFKPYL